MHVRHIAFALFLSVASHAQVTLPEGTKIRLRLEQTVSSATAEEGQTVEFIVAEAISVNGAVVVKEGARATGTVTEAVGKRRMGRAGKLDFSIDRVSAVDNHWVPLRYTVRKKSGDSHSLRTGIITAGVAVAFWPAAPAVLLLRGKDISINKGTPFEVFTDNSHVVAQAAAPASVVPAPARIQPAPALVLAAAQPAPAAPPAAAAPVASVAAAIATVTVTSPVAGAEIEVDGQFVGNTPTTLRLSPGKHQFTVKSGALSYQRLLQVTAGSTVSLNATLSRSVAVARQQ
jgi:hypothetical protein